MLPPVVQRQIEHAEAVAAGLHEAASVCQTGQEALRARLIEGGQTIKIMVALAKSATWAAKVNHDTIVEMQQP